MQEIAFNKVFDLKSAAMLKTELHHSFIRRLFWFSGTLWMSAFKHKLFLGSKGIIGYDFNTVLDEFNGLFL